MKEIQCEEVEVTKFRTEIKSECRTKKDQVLIDIAILITDNRLG